MMNISKLHLEILDEDRVEALEKLAIFCDDFVLAGGTALALQIGHRKSYDFDFFSKNPIPENLIIKIKNIFNIEKPSLDNADELSLQTKNKIKLSFVYYPFPVFDKFLTMDNGLKIFPLLQIAAQKAYVAGRRAEYRDIFDIYSILKMTDFTLKEIINETEKVFGDLFNSKLFLEQLVFFDDFLDMEIEPPTGNIKIDDSSAVKEFLSQKTKEYMENTMG